MIEFARPHPRNPRAEYASRTLAGRSLIDFTTYTYPRYIAEDFHVKVCDILQNAMEGRERRIMIFAPPQHGKSEIVSVRFPTYWLGHKPDKPVIICSYGALLAKSKESQARRIIFSKTYRNIFPKLFDNDDFREQPKDYLKLFAARISSAGVGGSITGFGAGLGIIDDPVKNYEQALSQGYRDRCWQWYQTTFRTRIWEEGVIVLIMTRWHEDDLAGRLLNSQSEKWSVYRFPALSEPQEVRDLISEKQGRPKNQPDALGRNPGQPLTPIRFSRVELRSIEEEVGPLAWSAEYQGFPQIVGGNMFKEEWFHEIDVPPLKVDKWVRYWDKAATAGGGARSAGVLMGYSHPYYIIADVIKGQWSTYQREDVIRQVAEQDNEIYGNVTVWVEEEGGSGGKDSALFTISNLAGIDVHVEHPTKAKEIRASPLASQAEAGFVKIVKAAWNRSYIAEMIMFPNSTYKDQVDASSGAFLKVRRRGWARGAGG